MNAFEQFLVGFCKSVILSYKSTFFGLLVAAAVMFVGAAQTYPNHYVQIVAALVLVPFLAWRDQKVKDGTIKLFVIAFFFVAVTASACSFIHKEFGSSIGTDELGCVDKVPADVLANVESALATDGANYIAVVQQVAVTSGKDFAACVLNTAIADFNLAHANETMVSRNALSQDVHTAAIARAQFALRVLQASDAGQ